jgi:hypothetical protein
MTSRNATPFLILAILVLLGGAGALLGLSQSKNATSFATAVTNTLGATSYDESVVATAQGVVESDHLTYNSPDKLGGYVQRNNQRTYVYIIGGRAYETKTVAASTPTSSLTFYSQPATQLANASDPVRQYLRLAGMATNVVQHGQTFTFSVNRGGQTGQFSGSIAGNYISTLNLKVTGETIDLSISNVNSAGTVSLPAGATVKNAPNPATSSTGSASSAG